MKGFQISRIKAKTRNFPLAKIYSFVLCNPFFYDKDDLRAVVSLISISIRVRLCFSAPVHSFRKKSEKFSAYERGVDLLLQVNIGSKYRNY